MAKARSKLNNKPKAVIEKEILNENPEGLPPIKESKIAIAAEMPRMETIIFRNDRDPGIPLTFHFAAKGHPLHHYTLYHGQEHTLPVEVIEHLESCAIPIYAYRKGPDGHPQMYQNGKKYSFTCKTVRNAA
jgi:hypothetical protein